MKKYNRDHTMPSLDVPGRYEGDCFAALKYDPMRNDRYKWLVEVAVWREMRYTAQGHANGYEDSDYWAEPRGIFGEFTSKRFRTAEKAIAYLMKVRSAADAEYIRRRLSRASEASRTRVA